MKYSQTLKQLGILQQSRANKPWSASLGEICGILLGI